MSAGPLQAIGAASIEATKRRDRDNLAKLLSFHPPKPRTRRVRFIDATWLEPVAFDWPTFTPHPDPPYDWRRQRGSL